MKIYSKLKRLLIYFRVWKIIALNRIQEVSINRASTTLFFLGKIFRFGMSLLFLLLIHQKVASFSGYTTDQVIVFFLTYNFLDVLSQTVYRGVYTFSNLIRTGQFDYVMSKPINPLFRALLGDPDPIDIIFILSATAVSLYVISQLTLNITINSALLYSFLLVNSFFIATGLHILVLCFGVIATQVDGAIWLFRDVSRLGQFPVTIYLEPVRFALFFLLPIGMMFTIPAQVLTNLKPSYDLALVTFFGISFLISSLKLWRWSLKKYSSASS